jgi:hypothetical protein
VRWHNPRHRVAAVREDARCSQCHGQVLQYCSHCSAAVSWPMRLHPITVKCATCADIPSCDYRPVMGGTRPIWYMITQTLDYSDGRGAMHCQRPKAGCENSAAGCSRWGAFTLRPWVYQGLDPRTLANSYLAECASPPPPPPPPPRSPTSPYTVVTPTDQPTLTAYP